MKGYRINQAQIDRLYSLINRKPEDCTNTERTVCKAILESLVQIEAYVEKQTQEPGEFPVAVTYRDNDQLIQIKAVRPDGGVLCTDGFVRYPDRPSLLGYD